MAPARVLYVTISMDLGGTERQLLELAAGLDRSRFEPSICCLRGAGALAGECASRDIPITAFGAPGAVRPAGLAASRDFLSLVFSLAGLMKRERPAIVHGMLPAAWVAAGLAARLSGVPVLVTGRRCLGHYKDRRPLLRHLENAVNRWTDAVVPNSAAVRDDTLARERIAPGKVRVIHNGVRIPDAPPGAGWRGGAGAGTTGPAVALVANFFPYKGHMDFLDAAAEVLRGFPSASFVLVGDGKLRPEIERRASAPDLAGRAILLGSRPDGGDVMALSDVAALASHEEGFPNVVLEAMARARPVVATRVGGVPEAVEDGVTGILVPPRDAGAMAGALLRLLRDPRLAAEMGARGMERVRRDFTVDRMVRAHEDLYAELLARAATRRHET